MPSNRQLLSDLYKPVGVKVVQAGIPWVSGGQFSKQGIDLSLPTRGFRIVLSGRVVIGTADMASVTPEGLLNLIQRIRIMGTNKRQGGAVTLWDIDMATAYTMQHLFERMTGYFDIGGTLRPIPSTPFPAVGANGYFNATQGTYDFRIVVDLPFHPFSCPAGVRAGFLVRQEEYSDSLQVILDFGQVTNGAVAGALGTGAAGTTYAFTANGSGAGNTTVDIYSLPVQMGTTLKDKVLPGLLVRTAQPIAAVLQAAGNGVSLLDLQKQKTTRVIAKFGTSTVAPYFATLSDTNVTALGILLGGNRSVRDVVSVFAHKMSQIQHYGRDPIQGYNVLDFMQSGNPDSGYPANQIGAGSSLQLVANVTGVANAAGIIVQEQLIFAPDGSIYNP